MCVWLNEQVKIGVLRTDFKSYITMSKSTNFSINIVLSLRNVCLSNPPSLFFCVKLMEKFKKIPMDQILGQI